VRLKDLLADLLREKGIERIYTPIRMESRDPIQQIAVHVANGKINICKAEKETRFSYSLDGKFVDKPADAFAGNCKGEMILSREELVEKAEVNFPYIIVDCSFFDLHSEKEKSRLKVQLKATLGVIRDFMWDAKLVVTGKSIPSSILSNLSPNTLLYSSIADFIKENSVKNIILLDPSAEKVFTGEKAECYIIGGIVDKSGDKKGLTGRIGEMLRREGIKFESMRIELRGDVVGVPDRINAVAEMVLLSVLDGLAVEETIKKVQSPLVARWRLKKELPKISKRVDGRKAFRFVKKSDFRQFNWLNIAFKDFLEVSRQLGFLVLSDDLSAEIEKLDFDPVKRRYIFR
jgi:tRNA (adenine9-N1/guanine9-N1)-methyltransferase